jgi:hypothetical protein
MTPEIDLFTPNLNDAWLVQLQRGDCRAAHRRSANENDASPAKMLQPNVSAWMKQRRETSSARIGRLLPSAFP